MEPNEAQTLARQLLDRHGLAASGWTFRFDHATRRLGSTRYDRRQISLSRTMVEISDSEMVLQVLLHELGHALLPERRRDGSRIGRGREWKRLARELLIGCAVVWLGRRG